MLRLVEQARGLRTRRPVPGEFLGREQLMAKVKEHVGRELPPEAIQNEGLSLQLMGFLPIPFDYEAAEYQLLESELAGYYEPSDGTMYMARDLGDEEANATLAHELVHALQDQYWDLAARSKYRAGMGDLAGAVSALAEGDASSAMYDVMIARAAPGGGKSILDVPDEQLAKLIRDGVSQSSLSNAPHVMRTSLVAPYVYGTLFVHALRRREGWQGVDEAWGNAPQTTEQILHVEKWLAHEQAIPVPAPPVASLGAGWRVVDEDSEGELGARIAFEEWTGAAKAAELSAGWGGDRSVLASDGARAAFAWALRYDPVSPGADPAGRAFAAVAEAVARGGPSDAKGASFACRERTDRGPIAVAYTGRTLVMTLGPARRSTAAWSSAATCGFARSWTREILAYTSR